MANFLKVSEVPATKLRLKKAILNGTVKVYEVDYNRDNVYRLVENVNLLIKLWSGFHFNPKYYSPEQVASASLGTSFYYKFSH